MTIELIFLFTRTVQTVKAVRSATALSCACFFFILFTHVGLHMKRCDFISYRKVRSFK